MKKDSNVLLYSIIDCEIKDFIDSPPLEIFNVLLYYNILKSINPNLKIDVKIEPIGFINKNYTPSSYNNIRFFYSSSLRHKGIKNPILDNFLKKNRFNNLIFLDLYNGTSNYIDYNSNQLLSIYPEIRKVYRHSSIPDSNSFITNLYKGLPFIDDFDIESLLKFFKMAIIKDLIKDINVEQNIFPYMISSGCKYSCSFCTNLLNKYSFLNINYINRDINKLKNEYHIEKIVILDQYPNLNIKLFNEFLDIIIRNNLKVHFTNGLGLLHLNYEIVKKLKDCAEIIYLSPETGSDRLLKLLKKPFNTNIIESRLEMLYKYSIPVKLHLIYDIPHEKKIDVIRSYKKIGEWISRFNINYSTQRYVCKNKLKAQRVNKQSIYSLFFLKPSKPYYAPLNKYLDIIKHKGNEKKLIINVSYRCNNRCVFCSVGDRDRVDGDLLFQIEIARKFYNEGYRLLDIDGGEPFIYPNIFNLLKEVKKIGYESITITTNGRMLYYDKLISNIKKFDNINIIVSLHSAKASEQKQITNSNKSYEQTIIGIKNLIRLYDINKISINTTLTKINCRGIKEIAKLAHNLGINKLNIQYYTPFGIVKPYLVPSRLELINCIEETLNYCQKMGIDVKLVNFEFCMLPQYSNFMYDDYFKSERYMVFVDKNIVNLSEYLSQRRKRDKDCFLCEYQLLCKGHWVYE